MTTEENEDLLSVRAETIGLLEVQVQMLTTLLERAQGQLAHHKHELEQQLRKEAGLSAIA